ncbi:hypothetical protein GGU11DRAFT_761198, partial [Lentinula aff. detonsa]
MPRPSSLSSAQTEVINAYFPTWEALLIKHKLQFGKDRSEKDPAVVLQWVTDTTTSILKTEPFKSVDYTVQTQKHWENLIATAFKNHRNNNLVARTLKALGEKARGEAEGRPVTVPHHADFEEAGRVLLSFLNKEMPKTIFETENKDAIKKLAEKQRAAESGLNPGKAYQAALTELWAQADRDSFIAKAKAVDVFGNQTLFRSALYAGLQGICEGGAVGPTEMVSLTGFRDRDNVVISFRLNAHHVFNEHKPIPAFLSTPEEKQLADALDDAWRKYCKKIIPEHVKPEAQIALETSQADDPDLIEYNTRGIPVFSKGYRKLGPDSLLQHMIAYRKSLWSSFTDQNFIDFSFPNIAIPLSDIRARPGDFLNIHAFGEECAGIATVEDLSEDIARLYQFATYLSSVSNANIENPLLFVTALPKSPKPVSSVEKAAEKSIDHGEHASETVFEAQQTSVAPEIPEVGVDVAASDTSDAIVIHADASDSQNTATL